MLRTGMSKGPRPPSQSPPDAEDSRDVAPAVALLPIDPARDVEMLARWLSAPHVARWWGGTPLDELLAPPPGGGHALIAVDGTPVGFIQWGPNPPEELAAAGLIDLPPDTIDIDLFIGEPEWLGRGIGSAALARLAAQLRAEPRSPPLMICTSVDNERAFRAFQRAGFRPLRQFDDPQFGRMWLLGMGL